MTVPVHIPSALRIYCRGASEVNVNAATVREALEQIEQNHPSLYVCVCNETGAVRPHINLFVNDSFLHDRNGLDTKFEPGDTLTIMPAVSGG